MRRAIRGRSITWSRSGASLRSRVHPCRGSRRSSRSEASAGVRVVRLTCFCSPVSLLGLISRALAPLGRWPRKIISLMSRQIKDLEIKLDLEILREGTGEKRSFGDLSRTPRDSSVSIHARSRAFASNIVLSSSLGFCDSSWRGCRTPVDQKEEVCF